MPLSFFNSACRGKDLHQRQWIRLHLVAYLACNNAVTTIQNHWIKVHNMPLAKTVTMGNTPINIVRRKGMVTLLRSSHFQVLRSLITSLHSTWHTVRNLLTAQAKDILQVVGHDGKDITCTKAVMAGLKCSPLRRSQDKGCQLQVDWECLLDCW
jgi:hypothetical protein